MGVCADDNSEADGKRDPDAARPLTIGLADFVWEALEEESAKLSVPIEELASFSVLYYLADRDSGRIARRLPSQRPLGEPHPLGNS